MIEPQWRLSHVMILVTIAVTVVLGYLDKLESRLGGIALAVLGLSTLFAASYEFKMGRAPVGTFYYERKKQPFFFWSATIKGFLAGAIIFIFGLVIFFRDF